MDFTLSYTEENYIKAIYHLSSGQDQEVSTTSLSESMKTKPATVSDMIKRLSKKKVISYAKYKGVNLTEEGKSVALNIIRKHRLWEVFLVDKLNFSWDEVHDIAEQMEHIRSPLLVERLDDFLGNPSVDPHGDPIPDKHGNYKVGPTLKLADMNIRDEGFFVKVGSDDPSLLQYLDKLKIRLGHKVTVEDKIEFDGSMQVRFNNQDPLSLSSQTCELLIIRKSQ